jgi:putative peptide zinc metalloprotease protein
MNSSPEKPDFAVREIEVTSPRLREGLKWTFQEVRGEGSYLLEDPLSGKYYRPGRKEYEFVRRLDGNSTVSELVATASRGDVELAIEGGDAVSLVRMLVDAGLVTTSDSEHAGRVWAEVNHSQEFKRLLGKVSQVIFLKIPLCNPDRFFAFLAERAGWLVGPGFAALWVLVMIWGGGSLYEERGRFSQQMSGLFDFGNLWILGALWLGLKVFHECWHGIVCRRFGGVVPEAGVTLLLFTTPLGYVNASSSTAFPSKWQRIAVSAAGIYGELFVAAIAAILWARVEPGALSASLHQVVVLSSVTTVLFNANPLMRFDGYYILSDLFDIPNLYTKGNKVSQWVFRRWILGMKKAKFPLAKTERRGFISVYGIAAACWKVLVTTGLLIGAAFLFKGAGLIIAVVVATTMLIQSISGAFQYLKKSAAAEGLRPARLVLRVVAILALITSALFLIKVTPLAKAPAVVQDVSGGGVRVDCPGFLTQVMVTDGEVVQEGDLLARLENIEEISRLRILETEIESSRIKRDQFLEEGGIAASQAETENLASLEEIATELRGYTGSLELRASRAGMVESRHLDLLLGTWIEPGRELFSVAAAEQRELLLLVAPEDRESFEEGKRAAREVEFRPRGRWQTWTAGLRESVPRASLEPVHFALISPAGGPLPVKQCSSEPAGHGYEDSSIRAAERYELVKPRFEMKADLNAGASEVLKEGETGVAVMSLSDRRSLADLGIRFVKRQLDTLIEQRGGNKSPETAE